MEEKLKEVYKTISPTKGEDDLEIYQQRHELGKSVNEIAFEFERETASIYRALNRLERFLKSDLKYYDVDKLTGVVFQDIGIRGASSIVAEKIVRLALAVFFTTGKEYLDKYYCNLIQTMHPCAKNNKEKIMKEMKNVHWYFFGLGTSIKIFDSFVYSRNRIDFEISDFVRIMLLSVKDDIEKTP